MLYYAGKRIAAGIALLLTAMVVVFFIFEIIGDPVVRILPVNATDEQIEVYREAHGYNDPMIERLGRFMYSVVTLDFGMSTTVHRPALAFVIEAVPRTLALAAVAFVITVCGAMALATWAATHPGGRIDRIVIRISTVLISLPEFWLGLILILAVAVHLRLVPTSGYGLDTRVILPAIALAIPPMGRLAFFIRNNLIATLQEPHVSFARSLGLPQMTLLRRHVIRNAALPTMALAGLEVSKMITGGAVVVETVFAWPGLGRLYTSAMDRYDLPLISATLFTATALVICINVVLDIIYASIDPRVRLT